LVGVNDYTPAAGELSSRVILVTGATQGIGRALASGLVQHGATVIAHGRRAAALDALYNELREQGPEPAVAELDLARAQGPDYMALTDEIERRYGRLDGLVLNAGILGDRSPIEHYDIGVWQQVIHVNLNAQFILLRCLLPLLRNSADASIVMTTSSVGKRGRAHWGAYAVSKFGLEGLAQVLAEELVSTQVRVNCVNPGRTRTRMRALAYPGEDPASLPPPEKILGTFYYLLGPASRGVTGERFDCQQY
jgi:NAD(P)-dependent dehydrogenase (short-subunit alcohol dehydrogenase family)